MKMTLLYLTLHKKWFDLILSGKKKEEYREIKPYWAKRLQDKYTHILFRNGYGKDKPSMLVECKGITVDFDSTRYVIKLGKIISKQL